MMLDNECPFGEGHACGLERGHEGDHVCGECWTVYTSHNAEKVCLTGIVCLLITIMALVMPSHGGWEAADVVFIIALLCSFIIIWEHGPKECKHV